MFQYAIYQNPTDYPNKFVLRKWTIGPGTTLAEVNPVAVVDSLEDARDSVPEGLFLIPRSQEDDPVIVEVWI